ncbi:MAG: ATP-binding cassette domain-containing protein [Magnetococcales bacterium]|nr:ATP-binding cassette domain-containing protein [Magnetococcales bacterium]
MRENDPFFVQKAWLQRLNLFSVVRPYFVELLLVSLMINLLSLLLPLVLLQIYDRIIRFAAISTLQWLLAGLFVAMLLEAAMRYGRAYISGWIGARFEYRAACDAMQQLLSLSWQSFVRSSSGVYLERMAAIQTLKEFYSGQAALVVLELPFVILYLLLIYHLAGSLIWVPILLLLLFALSAWYFQTTMYHKIKQSGESDERRLHFIIETLTGIHSVKALGLESAMARRYERLLTHSAAEVQDIGLHGADAQNMGMLFSQLATIAMVSIGGVQVIEQQLTVGGLIACSMLAGRALQPLQTAAGIWARFQSIRIARAQLQELFVQEENEVAERASSHQEAKGVEHDAGIEIQQITFLAVDQRPVLQSLSLRIAAGECVGIMGANGCGKSLLLSLILGMVKPHEGMIRVDGVDPFQQRPAGMAMIPQEGVLLRGSVLDNLHLFREELADSAKKAARMLGVEEFILSLPKGYDTLIDDGNQEMIPRGIKQRMVIARALVIQPRFLLFDEANMAIDGNGEERVRQVLAALRGHCTVLLISQRPSLLRVADRVLALRDGRLWPLPGSAAMAGE